MIINDHDFDFIQYLRSFRSAFTIKEDDESVPISFTVIRARGTIL
jgi:hypothetical protein